MSDTKDLTLTRHLPVKLDQYRLNVLRDQAANANALSKSLTEKLEQLKKGYQGEIKKAEQERHVALDTIHKGFEMQEVAIEERPDLERNVMITTRLDTMEQLKPDRPMTPEEIRFHKKAAMRSDGQPI